MARWTSLLAPTTRRAALTAAAHVVSQAPPGPSEYRSKVIPTEQEWQREAWGFYDSLGIFRNAVNWKADMLSRVRLKAAKRNPGDDEPDILDSGPAYDIINELSVGVVSQIMANLTVYISVPGEGYLIGETIDGVNKWQARSAEEVRYSPNAEARTDYGAGPVASPYEVVDERAAGNSIRWRRLAPDSLVVRIWRPHKRWFHVADSSARSARSTMRELELVNRRFQAEYMSRLASAGMVIFPTEVIFPVREEFRDADDPFVEEWIAMAAEAIKTPGAAASLVPFPIRVPSEYVDKVQHIDFTVKLDEKLIEKRHAAQKQLAIDIDVPPEALMGMADVNHWCVDNDTMILTDHGWVPESELSVGDVVLTLNHETGMSEWQPVKFIYRADVVDYPMISMEQKNHSSVTTRNHRWPTLRIRQKGGVKFTDRQIRHTEDLDQNDYLVTAAPCADLPTEVKVSDALVELVAWLWTEGNVRGRICSIAQSHTANPERVILIRAALTELFGPAVRRTRGLPYPAWREVIQDNESSHGGPVTVFYLNQYAAEPLLAAAPGKIVSPAFVRNLTRAQLELFIDRSCQGDGQHYRSGRLDIWQRDPAALAGYELALILSGRSVVTTGDRVSPWPGSTARPMKSPHGTKQAETVSYTGTLWCPVTDNSTWLASRRGTVYFTGNTAWLVEETGFKVYLAPDCELICHALTEGYLIPRLVAAGEPTEGMVVWYDASEIILRPDRSSNAVLAYDRGEITGEGLRRETGMDESDAPTDDELTKIILRKIALLGGADSLAALKELTGVEVDVPAPVAQVPVDAPEVTGAPVPAPEKNGPPELKPVPDAPKKAAAAELDRQGALDHAIRVSLHGWQLLHPPECARHLMSCPVTYATWKPMQATPGTSGVYQCWLGPSGEAKIGKRLADADVVGMLPTLDALQGGRR